MNSRARVRMLLCYIFSYELRLNIHYRKLRSCSTKLAAYIHCIVEYCV